MMTLLRGARLPLLVAALALALYAFFFAGPYALRLLTLGGIYALLVLGYQLIFGHAGALSLAQGAFFGVGAYATGILATRYGWGFAATFPLALLLPTLLAALVAAPVLRLRSHYLALATLGIAEVLRLAAGNWQEMTGGANGLPGIPGIVLLGVPIASGLPLLAIVWSIVVIAALLIGRALRGPVGDAFQMIREAPLAAAATGLDAGMLRFTAFLASALCAGAAGALYAHAIRVVSPEALGFPVMVSCLTMTVLGGRTRIAGALLGALLLVALPEWLRFLGSSYLLVFGLALLAMIILAPDGAVAALEHLFPAEIARAAPAIGRLPSPPRDGEPLRLAGIIKRFGGVTALAGVDLELAPGSILGLIGPNGSGKTTLINVATGVERADAGRIRLGAQELGGLPAHRIARLGIARSFQSPILVEAMTPLDTVTLSRLVAGAANAAARGEAMALLAEFGAAAVATLTCGQLPHGQRRRVELARALALEPRFLLLDEPSAGLAPDEVTALAGILRALAARGHGLLIVEHNLGFLMPLADRIVCLDRGAVIGAGTVAEAIRDPKIKAAYLGGEAILSSDRS